MYLFFENFEKHVKDLMFCDNPYELHFTIFINDELLWVDGIMAKEAFWEFLNKRWENDCVVEKLEFKPYVKVGTGKQFITSSIDGDDELYEKQLRVLLRFYTDETETVEIVIKAQDWKKEKNYAKNCI